MALKHVVFDTAQSMAFGSITNAYTTLLSLGDDADVMLMWNSTDAIIEVTLGSATHFIMPPSSSFALDGRTNSKRIPKGIIKIRYSGAVPTSGIVSASIVR